MGLLSNVTSSISGKVEKALLCVKKPAAAETNQMMNDMFNTIGETMPAGMLSGMPTLGGAISNVDLRAKMVAGQKGFLSSFTSMKAIAGQNGYHVMEVKYNPSRIRFYSNGGNQMMPGPDGNMQVQSIMPAMTTMQVELLFDDTNNQDAFMMEKFSNLTAGAVVSDIAGIVKNAAGDGYSVQAQIEGMIALLTQSETRQVVFYWGDTAFAGEVVALEAKYTMFNPLGHPIRGKVNLTIREGGPDADGSGNEYWNDAYNEMMKGGGLGSKLAGATGNLLNLK